MASRVRDGRQAASARRNGGRFRARAVYTLPADLAARVAGRLAEAEREADDAVDALYA
jgi:hypothetical protein